MKKQTTNAIKLLALAVFLAVVPACQTTTVSENKTNNSNAVVVEPVSNANTNSANNLNTVEPVSNDNADSKSETKSDEKLTQRILGVWEGTNPAGDKVSLEFKDDNLVYPNSKDKKEKPAKYKVIDEGNVELTTPDEKPEIYKIKVNGDKMSIIGETGTNIELTKVK